MSEKTDLTPAQIKVLRTTKQISETETAYFVGDLLVVENVITGNRRVVDSKEIFSESNRRILKG